MKIVIAPDKFKGSLSSFEVCDAIEKGLLKASSSFQTIKLPMADGGDGLSEVIAHYTNAKWQTSEVQNPLGKTIEAQWLLSSDGKTAFVEMAKASGLQLLKPEEYNPSLTSTFGTGQLIKAAIRKGVKNIIIGVGGSATNDAGIGMAAALGYRFFDGNKNELDPIGKNLVNINTIDTTSKIDLSDINFKIACDVKNLLFGEQGAAKVYAPQKGANSLMVRQLEEGMIHFASVIKNCLDIDVSHIEGGGAAGGLGAGCVAFLNASLMSGIELVMQLASVENHIRFCDLVITGEGRIDDQSLHGKVISGISAVSKKYNKRVIAVCGSVSESFSIESSGIDDVYSILNSSISLQESLQNAAPLLESISKNIGSLIL